MATPTILTGSYPSGFTVLSSVGTLIVDDSASVGGTGIHAGVAKGSLTVSNEGQVSGAPYGLYVGRPVAMITNGASDDIDGYIGGSRDGIDMAAGTVTNFGSIAGGEIAIRMTSGRVVNLGSILSTLSTPGGEEGVYGGYNAVVVNGSTANQYALISGYTFGVDLRSGTVTNYGAISASYTGKNPDFAGVYLANGGTVTNGIESGHLGVRISGRSGVVSPGGYTTVLNSGEILGQAQDAGGAGVMINGGEVSNAFEAVISGWDGIYGNFNDTIANDGRISGKGQGGAGVELTNGGSLQNGDYAYIGGAVIAGNAFGVNAAGADVKNLGRIFSDLSNDQSVGVYLSDSAFFANGGNYRPNALVQGAKFGVELQGKSDGENYGILEGYVAGYGAGVYGGSDLTNKAGGVIRGSYGGAIVEGKSTLANYGTIIGAYDIVSVILDPTSTLYAAPGAVFEGFVEGRGGRLVLPSGAGTAALAGYGVTISGDMPTAGFGGFGTIDVAAAASLAVVAAGTIIAGETLEIEGAVSTTAAIAVAGAVAVDGGHLSGAGSLTVGAGGLLALGAGAALTVSQVTLSKNSSQASLAGGNLVYAGLWTQQAGTLTVAAPDTMSLTRAGDLLAGTVAGTGRVVVAGATSILRNATISGDLLADKAGVMTLQGTISLASTGILEVSAATLNIIASGVTLTGAGELELAAGGKVSGAATTTLTNAGFIDGEGGTLGAGKLVIVNQASGDISGDAGSTVVDTGASTIVNAGRIVASTGNLTIKSAVVNTGTLLSQGVLTLDAAVTGAGVVQILNGGVADFVSSFSENVTFLPGGFSTPPSGVLELAESQTYTGTVSGFSTTGSSSFDLLDIAFGASTKATFAGTAASGMLTITDGTHTAKITLLGDYTGSTFTVASDGHGGTSITDPETKARAASVEGFASAMAAMGRTPGGVGTDGTLASRGPTSPDLMVPRMAESP